MVLDCWWIRCRYRWLGRESVGLSGCWKNMPQLIRAPAGHGRSLPLDSPTGLAVLACAAAFAGRPPRLQSLTCRVPGRLTASIAQYWVQRWRGCLPPPADADQRARRLGRDLERYRRLQIDIAAVDEEIAGLL